jgi:hypothetical protein
MTADAVAGQKPGSLARHPTLPPKQRSDYQVEVGGKIRLASLRGARARAQYKQATSRQRAEVPSGQVPKATFDLISHDCRSHSLTHHESHQRRSVAVRLDQQMT